MLRVVICDHHRIFGEAMAGVLAGEGYDVVACTDEPASGSAAVARHRPELYVVDLHLGPAEEANGFGDVRAASPATRVVVVTGSSDPLASAKAKDAGADGFVAKDRRLDDILDAIARVAGGEAVFHGPVANGAPRSGSLPVQPWRRGLTPREREILDRLVEGQETAALARELGMSYSTARTHIQRLLAKLGVHSKLEAVALANRDRDDLDGGTRTGPRERT